MILKHLADRRDFCFVCLKQRNGEKYAEQEYKLLLKILCGAYYMSLFNFRDIFQFKAGIAIPLIMKDTILGLLIFGSVFLILYNLLFRCLFNKMSPLPIDKNMQAEKFKFLMRKTIVFVIIGIALMVLIPWSMDRLLPPFYS